MHDRSLRPFIRGRLTLGFERRLGSLPMDSFNRTFYNRFMTRSNAELSTDCPTGILVGNALLATEVRLVSE